jgi:Domain of unknown function (DUF4249)
VQRIFHNILFLTVLTAFLGCERDLEYDLPGATPRLVVNSLFSQDSLMRIEVSVSASPGNGASIRSLRDARIFLFEDQLLVKDFSLDSLLTIPLDFQGNPIVNVSPTKLFFHHTLTTKARDGVKYLLEVRYPELATISASAILPRPMSIRTIDQPLNESILVNGQALDRLVFEIDDNGGTDNYYGLEILAFKPGSNEKPHRIVFFSGEKSFAENIVVSDGQHSQGVYYLPANGVYFSNGKFKGRRKQFEAYVDPNYMTPQYQLRVRVLTLSKPCFDFVTSYQKQKLNANNPFAEPTQVYSNIDGGLGIFAGYSVTEADF